MAWLKRAFHEASDRFCAAYFEIAVIVSCRATAVSRNQQIALGIDVWTDMGVYVHACRGIGSQGVCS